MQAMRCPQWPLWAPAVLCGCRISEETGGLGQPSWGHQEACPEVLPCPAILLGEERILSCLGPYQQPRTIHLSPSSSPTLLWQFLQFQTLQKTEPYWLVPFPSAKSLQLLFTKPPSLLETGGAGTLGEQHRPMSSSLVDGI